MAGNKVLEIRPFRSDLDGPFPDSLPECGLGEDKQVDLHPSRLLDVATPKTGVYFPELVRLTKKLNAVYAQEGPALLRKKQREVKDKTLELTIALTRGGLYLTYARPVRGRAGRKKA
jgi:hypothetical protein